MDRPDLTLLKSLEKTELSHDWQDVLVDYAWMGYEKTTFDPNDASVVEFNSIQTLDLTKFNIKEDDASLRLGNHQFQLKKRIEFVQKMHALKSLHLELPLLQELQDAMVSKVIRAKVAKITAERAELIFLALAWKDDFFKMIDLTEVESLNRAVRGAEYDNAIMALRTLRKAAVAKIKLLTRANETTKEHIRRLIDASSDVLEFFSKMSDGKPLILTDDEIEMLAFEIGIEVANVEQPPPPPCALLVNFVLLQHAHFEIVKTSDDKTFHHLRKVLYLTKILCLVASKYVPLEEKLQKRFEKVNEIYKTTGIQHVIIPAAALGLGITQRFGLRRDPDDFNTNTPEQLTTQYSLKTGTNADVKKLFNQYPTIVESDKKELALTYLETWLKEWYDLFDRNQQEKAETAAKKLQLEQAAALAREQEEQLGLIREKKRQNQEKLDGFKQAMFLKEEQFNELAVQHLILQNPHEDEESIRRALFEYKNYKEIYEAFEKASPAEAEFYQDPRIALNEKYWNKYRDPSVMWKPPARALDYRQYGVLYDFARDVIELHDKIHKPFTEFVDKLKVDDTAYRALKSKYDALILAERW